MSQNPQAASFDYDPFSPEVMQDPQPYYKILRRDHPVYYAEKYDGFFLSRFEDIVQMLALDGDNTLMESEGSLPTPAALRQHNSGAPEVPPDDPFPLVQKIGMPAYAQVRNAQIKPIMPGTVRKLADFVRARANERLDELLPTGSFNLTKDYGGYVSSNVMMHLLGMPKEEAAFCLDIVNSGTRTDPELGGFDSASVAKQAIQHYMPYIQARFDAGADGSVPMVDGLINYRYKGRALSVAEVAQNLVCAFIGGIESVPKVTAQGLKALADNPGQLAAVRSDLEQNVPVAVEEMLRFCAPAQWFMRTAHQPVNIAGQDIKPGQRLFYLVGSALRDENEFADPDQFQWNREIKRNLAFGHGVHFCLGAHIAKLEVKIMVQEFLRRVPDYSFDMDRAVRPPSSFQLAWNVLPVVIGEGAR